MDARKPNPPSFNNDKNKSRGRGLLLNSSLLNPLEVEGFFVNRIFSIPVNIGFYMCWAPVQRSALLYALQTGCYRSVRFGVLHTVKTEGKSLVFYRGALSGVLYQGLYSVLVPFAFGRLNGKLWTPYGRRRHHLGVTAQLLHIFFMGFYCGYAGNFVLYPLKLIECQMKADYGVTPFYEGLINCVHRTVKGNGLMSLYKGVLLDSFSTGARTAFLVYSFSRWSYIYDVTSHRLQEKAYADLMSAKEREKREDKEIRREMRILKQSLPEAAAKEEKFWTDLRKSRQEIRHKRLKMVENPMPLGPWVTANVFLSWILTILYPLQLVATHLTLSSSPLALSSPIHNIYKDSIPKTFPKSITETSLSCAKYIYEKRGIRGFFRGCPAFVVAHLLLFNANFIHIM